MNNNTIICPRCGKQVDLSDTSVYESEHTETNVVGRYIRTSNYTRREVMCRSCAFYRNRAESFFGKLLWILALIICVTFIVCSFYFSWGNGGFIKKAIAGVFIGLVAGFFMSEFLKYCFYAYDNVKMFFVRRKNKI